MTSLEEGLVQKVDISWKAMHEKYGIIFSSYLYPSKEPQIFLEERKLEKLTFWENSRDASFLFYL